MADIMVKVPEVKQEALDIKSFELVPTGGSLPAFTPAWHIDVHPAPGIVRQYSRRATRDAQLRRGVPEPELERRPAAPISRVR